MPESSRINGAIRAVVVAALTIAFAASAQDYPSKPLRMVAGMAAGGGADTNARRLAPILARIVKQSIVVDNIRGRGGESGGADRRRRRQRRPHAAVCFAPDTRHQSAAVRASAVQSRSAHTGRAREPDAAHPARQFRASRGVGVGTRALRKSQARHGQLRLRRLRHVDPPRGRASAKHGGYHARPRAVSRLRAGIYSAHRQ